MPPACVSRHCFNLYTIEQELTQVLPGLPHLRHIHAQWRLQVVFHAAAYKHVPLKEEDNAWAALRNNTLSTYRAALAA
tara:strand:+ start:2033 stop:2266 length:234 start_codon:yes stop_codon:yes gene_type:complete